FKANFSVDNPDGDPNSAIVIVTLPGGKEKGRLLLEGRRDDGAWRWDEPRPYEPNDSKAAKDRIRKAARSEDYQKLLAAIARQPTSERTEAGEQIILPGAEQIGQGEQAQRAADRRLKPKVAQKPPDEGLFGDDSRQTDLLDLNRARESGPSDS